MVAAGQVPFKGQSETHHDRPELMLGFGGSPDTPSCQDERVRSRVVEGRSHKPALGDSLCAARRSPPSS